MIDFDWEIIRGNHWEQLFLNRFTEFALFAFGYNLEVWCGGVDRLDEMIIRAVRLS